MRISDWSSDVCSSDLRVVKLRRDDLDDFTGTLRKMVRKSGEPVIRGAVTQAMRILGRQFVMGRSIGEALERARANEKKGYRYSYDMLGEAAHTRADARSEEHTSELQSLMRISYAVFCLNKKKQHKKNP